jgi:transcriptional regulator with XRE-family HTH domain
VARSVKSVERRLARGIAEKVRARRVSAGLSQEQLGDRAQMHRTYIGVVERGEKSITVASLARIARALRCKLSDLLPEE